MTPRYKSKTLATWLALLGGSLGLHRFYLRGWRDMLGWLHPLPTLLGVIGVERVFEFGQDDRLSWLLIPLLGVMVSQAMLMAIVYGLTPDARWDERHNPGETVHATRWAPILGVIAALMIGAGVLMATIAFGSQRFFEWQAEEAKKTSQEDQAMSAPGRSQRTPKFANGRKRSPSEVSLQLPSGSMRRPTQ